MAALERLAGALRSDKGYIPLAGLRGPEAPPLPEGFGFLGATDHWGSVATVGLVAADGLGPEELRRRAGAFHQLVVGHRAAAGRLVVGNAFSSREVALGSFGVAVFVYEGGADPGAVALLRGLRQGTGRDMALSVSWVADAPLGKVHGHRGLPLAMPPGRRWLEQAVRAAVP